VGKTYSRSPGIEAAPLQEEVILFDPASNQFCVLNRTASYLWNQLATPSSTESLAAGLCKSFSGVALEDAHRDTDKALQEMLSLNFVVGQP
jgi:hypothetical protein